MSAKKSVFNKEWCDERLNPKWSKWLEPDEKNPNVAKCLVCKKTFSLSNMGRQAVVSHEKGPKHQKNIGYKHSSSGMQLSLENFVKKSAVSTSVSTSESLSATISSVSESVESTQFIRDEGNNLSKGIVSNSEKSINKFFLNDQVTKAEILWCLRTVMTHSSFRSNSDLPDIFKLMFPDSEIASKLQLRKDKTSYTICFGLAPFFKNDLLTVLSSLESYVICFDESLNKVVKKGQMDIHVRFWQQNVNTVATRYLTSVFLGHSDAVSLLNALKSSIPESVIKNMLQISMDGPNVNLKLHSLLQNDLKENFGSQSLLDIGSCGLHIVHGAFKTGHKSTSWDLNKFLYAIFNLFKDSPARRADFVRYTNTSVFPLKFCSIRWVESSTVAQRALDILPHLRVFVQKVELANAEPNTKTYDTVKSMLKCSELLEAKLGFFISVASEVQDFLIKFQAGKPMAPFLYEEMYLMLNTLMKRFLVNSVVERNNSAIKLMKVDVTQKCNLLSITDVDIGFAARRSLKDSKATDAVKYNFRKECVAFLQKMTLKLIERNPLRYKLVRGISCLSPTIISSSQSSSINKKIEIALDCFVDCNRMTATTADKVKSEFCKFVECPRIKKEMSGFNPESDRLDIFYSNLIKDNMNYQNLFMFVRNVLILSHGNAAVESGFSINKALLVENMQEKSVVALRTVYDAVSSVGGLFQVNITKKMILAARNAHSFYHEELKAQKLLEKESKEHENKKRRAAEEIKELKVKKIKIQQEAEKQIAKLDCLIKDLNN